MKSNDQCLLEEAYKKVNQKSTENDDFGTFVLKRRAGAEKIANSAEDKGSYAILTAYHFSAKETPYMDALKLKDTDHKSKYFKMKAKEAFEKLKNLDKLTQKEFQTLTGIFEVYGEVYLQSKTNKDYSDL
jgi:hypothetical protein